MVPRAVAKAVLDDLSAREYHVLHNNELLDRHEKSFFSGIECAQADIRAD